MDKERKRKPNFLAYLPPRVRYDPGLSPTAKLLYAEITALSETDGYCWASNKYLAAVFSSSEATISRQISQLAEHGYLEQRMEPTKTGSRRAVYLTDLGTSRMSPWWEKAVKGVRKNEDTPLRKNEDTGLRKNEETGVRKNEDQNEIYKTNVPPYSPPRGTRRRNEHKDAPDWMPEDFARLWLWYPTGDKAMHPKRGNRQKAIRAWDRLRPSEELIDVIAHALGRQAESEEWREGVGIPHLSTYLNNYGWEGWTNGDN